MTTFLEPAEVASLTGYQRRTAQVKALQAMGIPYWVRCDGTPAVLRSTIEAQQPQQSSMRSATTQPDWGALPSGKVTNAPKRRLSAVFTTSRSDRQ
jgi:hypothetical protein